MKKLIFVIAAMFISAGLTFAGQPQQQTKSTTKTETKTEVKKNNPSTNAAMANTHHHSHKSTSAKKPMPKK